MADKKQQTPIEELESITDLSFFSDNLNQGSILWVMKKVILDQNKRIIELELSVDTLQRQLDRK